MCYEHVSRHSHVTFPQSVDTAFIRVAPRSPDRLRRLAAT